MTHIEVAKLVGTCEALHWQWPFGRNQNTQFIARKVCSQKVIERLKHESGAEFGDRAKNIDASSPRALDLVSNTEISMKRMRSLGAGENRGPTIDHRTLPWRARVTSENQRISPILVGPAARASLRHARHERHPPAS